MGSTTTDGEPRAGAQERARDSVEHLRAAAHELIEAARAVLDVAEEWVDDPESLASLAGTLAAVGAVARRVTGTGGWPHPAGGHEEPPEEAETRVERISVT